jgi:Peptidase A4 family
MKSLLRKALVALCLLGIGLALPASGAASPFNPSGVIKVVKSAHATLNATQSSNWFGYNASALNRGTLFNSISAEWTVPTVSRHAAGQAGDSATWIGIGGGCLSAGCTLTDATLIQAGTEQDVDSSGQTSYSAWWELVPAPGITVSNFSVSPGDHIKASISEAVADSEIWTITLTDTTKNENFSTTVPYASTHSTAEWIDETPVTIGSGGAGEASLPDLTETQFSGATINGAAANLASGEEVQLTDATENVIGSPSAPFAGGTAFEDCAWASSCATPSVAGPVSHSAASHKKRRHKRRRRRRHRVRHKRARHHK